MKRIKLYIRSVYKNIFIIFFMRHPIKYIYKKDFSRKVSYRKEMTKEESFSDEGLFYNDNIELLKYRSLNSYSKYIQYIKIL